jgi:hypothetical protein
MHYISILSTIITFAFTIAVLRRYHAKGGAHLLLWGFGLILYGLGTLSEVILSFTYFSFALKIWYLTGAMLTAAWLGEGTLHLLVRKTSVVRILDVILGLISLGVLVMILAAPVNPSAALVFDISRPVSAQYGDLLSRSGFIILFTILLNIYGTLALVGGALYSAFLFWRKKVLVNRMFGNILIAAGALMPAMGGSFVKAGLPDWLYLSEFAGAVLMYIGFIQATAGKPVKETPRVPASAD